MATWAEAHGQLSGWVVVAGEFLIVDFGLLNENRRAPFLGFIQPNHHSTIGLLGRRLMVGQVPLEHFV